jgi:hypothetical protein
MNQGIPGPLERTAGKQAEYQAEAEEAREAQETGYKSPLRRLIGRLLPSNRRRSHDLPGQDAAEADTPPGQFREL